MASSYVPKKRGLRFARLLVLLALAPALAACDDPSSVGLDLVGDAGGDPVRVRLAPSSFEPASSTEVTGGERSALAFSGVPSSTLVGRVDDPVFGEKTAAGYLDFQLAAFSQSFANRPVEYAELRLRPVYLYGDTSAVQTITLYEVTEDWEARNASYDTTFSVGDPILQFDFDPADSLLVVELPATWIERFDATLRSEFFNDEFHGFHLRAESSTFVGGFSANSSLFRMASAADTLTLAVNRVFTNVAVLRPARDLQERVVVQDGTGDGLRVDFDFAVDSLSNGALTRAVFSIAADTTLIGSELRPGFLRPPIVQLNLFGVTPEGEQEFLIGQFLNTQGRFVYASSASSTSNTRVMFSEVQDRLLGQSRYAYFLLRPPPSSNTLNAVPLIGALDDSDGAPAAVLTLVPSP